MQDVTCSKSERVMASNDDLTPLQRVSTTANHRPVSESFCVRAWWQVDLQFLYMPVCAREGGGLSHVNCASSHHAVSRLFGFSSNSSSLCRDYGP